jgi:hypothetical protein
MQNIIQSLLFIIGSIVLLISTIYFAVSLFSVDSGSPWSLVFILNSLIALGIGELLDRTRPMRQEKA